MFYFYLNFLALVSLADINVRECDVSRVEFSRLFERDPQLLGMQQLDPKSSEFKKFVSIAKSKITSPEEIPEVSHLRLKDLQKIHGTQGIRNQGVLTSRLDGKDVAIKIFQNKSVSEVVNEAKMLIILNKLGLGPEFHGMVRFPDGKMGFVTELISSGRDLSTRTLPSELVGFDIKPSVYREIMKTGYVLHRAGIRFTHDMQFLITSDGRAVLIDPEFFYFRAVPTADESPIENAKELVDHLKKVSRVAEIYSSSP